MKRRSVKSKIPGVTLHRMPVIRDPRGSLVAGEFKKSIGFTPKRYFMVFGVPSERDRGQHAHKKCHQYLVCVRGSLRVRVTDGNRSQVFSLNRLNLGVHVPPMVWCTHYGYKPGSILLVFASHFYDPADYVRDYRDYLKLALGVRKTTSRQRSASS